MKLKFLKQRRLALCFFLMLFLCPTLVLAQTKIKAVEFVGLGSLSEKTVLSRISSIEGTSFSQSKLSQDIKRLFKTGYFSQIEVEERPAPGGVKLIFKLVENNRIGKLTITGGKKIKEEDMMGAVQMREGEVLDEAKIASTKKEILKLYEEKGYFSAEIKITVEPYDQEANENEVIIKIHEGKPVRIRRITFLGNKAFHDKELRKNIDTSEKTIFSFLSGKGKYSSEKLEIDVQRLRFFYLDNGYLNHKVGEPLVTLTRNRRAIYIAIPIFEGDPFQVAKISVVGDILTTEQELLESLSLKSGKTYRKSLEFQDVQTLEKLYGDQAYAFANIVPSLTTHPESKEVDVTYFIQKGPKVKIDKIIINGNKVTRDKVIRRELRILENSYYSQSAIELSKIRLMQLGYFDDVNIATPRSNDNNKVNVEITVEERKNTGQFSVGAGFSTLETFVLTATIQKENFFGRGWSGGIQASLSKLRQDVLLNMTDRYFLDTRWQFGFTFLRVHSSLNRFFDENRLGGRVHFGREIFDFFTADVGYKVEDSSVSNFSPQVPAFFQSNSSGFTSALFSVLTYDRRDNKIFPRKGYYVSGSVEYSDTPVGATNNFLKFVSDVRLYIPVFKHLTLKGRGELRYIDSLDSQPLGLFERIFFGGPNTLRGFDLASIGPSLKIPSTASGSDSDFVFGGNKSLLLNAELEIPIIKQAGLHFVGFFDAGNTFAEEQEYSLTNMRMNYGFGFRWQSPLGPLRFEWGFPIEKRAGEPLTVFNFSFGHNF